MPQTSDSKIRIGAIRYLNSKPLTVALPRLAADAIITYDLPSRLADGVASGRLDVALLPSIESFRNRDYTIVSDVCVASNGPVRSVKLFSRVPIERISSLALDVGSRTSAALAQIVLKEQYDRAPKFEPLPIGAPLANVTADAMLLIGDRCIQSAPAGFAQTYDLGQLWHEWTGLPFVFAMWTAGAGAKIDHIADILAAAREEGLSQVEAIAREEAPRLGMAVDDCLVYLRDVLKFYLGPREREALQLFYAYAVKHQLAPRGADLVFCPATAGR